MVDVAAVVCDTVLPNFKRSLIFCGWMPEQGQLMQTNHSWLCSQLFCETLHPLEADVC